MASTTTSNNNSRLPPKAPGNNSTLLSEHLARTNRPLRTQSVGSHSAMSAASDTSREGLRREVLRRRKSLSQSEFSFLQGIVANGTEVEVQLVQKKLNDPSLCFDVDEAANEQDEGMRTSMDSLSHSHSISPAHTPTQQIETLQKLPPPPVDMIGQLLCPTLSEEHAAGAFDFEASIDTCASGRGKPPSAPIPLSPRIDVANYRVPSHAELYPDTSSGRPILNFDLDQTPLVQNLRPPKSLEGAAHLPIPGRNSGAAPDHHPHDGFSLMTPGASNTTAATLHRRSSNPLVDQLWKAHEQGLVVTPQQSTRRLQMRREQSLSALSPMRRFSRPSTSRSSSIHKSNTDRSLLNPQELRLIKQRHFRTQSQISAFASPQRHQQHAPHQFPHMQSVEAMKMMMVLQNASTDSSTTLDDISSLLLPTDEEIFRRSLQTAADHKRPPPPRPFKETTLATKSSGVIPKPPSTLKRYCSDGVTAGTATTATRLQRRPSALRRMTSEGSQRSKSVSFQIQETVPPQTIQAVASINDDDSLSTYASEHHPASEILRETGSLGLRDSEHSLNLHKARPLRQESIGSTASGWAAAQAFQQELDNKPSASGRKDSNTTSVASLNLHRAHPIRQDSIASTTEGASAVRSFQEELAFAAASASSPTLLDKPGLDSRSSVASLNLHKAHPIRQESIGSITDGAAAVAAFRRQISRRDSRSSVASLNLHKAEPLRQESIGSITDGGAAVEAFRRQFSAGAGFGRRESLNSLASLNLHIGTPIIQDSIFKRQDSMDSTVGGEGADFAEAFRPSGFSRRESMNSIASLDLHRAHPIANLGRRDSANSLASFTLRRAHPVRKDSIASTAGGLKSIEAFRDEVASQSWGRRDSLHSVASLNLHHGKPVRQESICSNASGWELSESFRREYSMEPDTALKPAWGRQSSMGSVASMNLHKAHPLPSEAEFAVALDILRNQGSAFSSEPDLFDASLNSLPPGQPLGLDSLVSTESGAEAKSALKNDFAVGAGESLRIASSGTVLSSTSDIAALHKDSMMSIPSLHPARPLRQDSIASTATGVEAKEMLRKQLIGASIVASEWEGVVLPEAWEDKKMEDEDVLVKVKPSNVRRPVFMRKASQSEYDEEGMEVAAVDELAEDLDREASNPTLKLKTQILVPEQPEGIRRESDSSNEETLPERNQNPTAAETQQRQAQYRHFPDSLTTFGGDSTTLGTRSTGGRSSLRTVEVSASFDESKSVDRYRGVFRGVLPHSISEDELSTLLLSQSKPKLLKRGQSDATLFPNDMDSSSWELDTVEGEYDAWDAIRDDYINGYGGGGTLPFQILGTSARDVDSHPHVMSPPLMESLQSFFPISKSHDNYWMKYSMVRDGASLHTLMQRARGARYSILAVETMDGEVFGAFTTEPWRKTWNYFGGGESFLWRMRHSRKTKCYSIIDQASMESEIDVYPYTGANQCVQLCTHNTIAVGGGSPEHEEDEEKRDDNDDHNKSGDLDQVEAFKAHEWGYGLALQADLQHGSSSPCLTFGSPSLSKVHSDGSLFEICNVELWGLTPCSNLMDAEKVELGRLFLEQPSFNSNHFE